MSCGRAVKVVKVEEAEVETLTTLGESSDGLSELSMEDFNMIFQSKTKVGQSESPHGCVHTCLIVSHHFLLNTSVSLSCDRMTLGVALS